MLRSRLVPAPSCSLPSLGAFFCSVELCAAWTGAVSAKCRILAAASAVLSDRTKSLETRAAASDWGGGCSSRNRPVIRGSTLVGVAGPDSPGHRCFGLVDGDDDDHEPSRPRDAATRTRTPGGTALHAGLTPQG